MYTQLLMLLGLCWKMYKKTRSMRFDQFINQLASKLKCILTLLVAVVVGETRTSLMMPSVFFLLWLRDSSQLHSILFTGSHTGAEIKAEFKQICLEFKIFDNVAYIISASASNMRKAFKYLYRRLELSLLSLFSLFWKSFKF